MNIRKAELSDLPAIIELPEADALAGRRDVSLPEYQKMFLAISEDPNQLLVVAELDGPIIGCVQISVIPGLSRGASWRGQLEGMRIRRDFRGHGYGRELVTG